MASDVCELTLKDKEEVGVVELNDIGLIHTYIILPPSTMKP